MKKDKVLSKTADWTFDLLGIYDKEIARIAKSYGLETFSNRVEIITAEHMLDAYAAVGMPLNYNHWSFGKKFLHLEKSYRRGHMGLAYEIVINADPCIAYLMEENSMMMQALVIAHACYGHNSFFKNNYLFKLWTAPDAILDYFLFAKNYIAECEEKYGIDAVEEVLDACHALMNYGVDRYNHPAKLSLQKERERQKSREEFLQSHVNELWHTIPKQTKKIEAERFPKEPQENLLYFIEKNSPLLESWQRELVRIVRKIAQYFYPQRQTQVMNEGWACFWHYIITNQLYDEGLVTNEFMMEFFQLHTAVIMQPEFDDPRYMGINPYALGFNIFMDIKRICEHPTEEDKHWFPELANTDWVQAVDFAMRNFKDESFIAQYLSPKVIRDMKLFAVLDNDQNPDLIVSAIHDEYGYLQVREALAAQYNLARVEPNIQIYNVDRRGDRSLTLRHIQRNRRPLNAETEAVLKYLHKLWGFTVKIESVDEEEKIQTTYQWPV